MNEATPRVVIGLDPHKRSVTIEVMTSDEAVVGKGRFGTDREQDPTPGRGRADRRP
jgi:hypothetical protein